MKWPLLKYCAFIISLLVVDSSQQPITKQELIQEAVEAKISRFKLQEEARCLKKAIKAAEENVDSIISYELGAVSTDSLTFPSKPSKPTYESFDSLKEDSIYLVPLFDSTTLKQPVDSIH